MRRRSFLAAGAVASTGCTSFVVAPAAWAAELQPLGSPGKFDYPKLAHELQPLRDDALQWHPWAGWADAAAGGPQQRMPGARSRWSGSKDLSWEPVRPERVCEVRYDHPTDPASISRTARS